MRRCLILGGSGGIGRNLAERLAARDWKLLLGARDEARLADAAEACGAESVALDATSFAAVKAAAARAKELFGGLDAAVCCVGSIFLRSAHATSQEDFDACVATNLTSAFATVRAAAPVLRGSGGGSIVLLSSAAAATGLPNHEAIAAAKAGVEGLTRAAAASYARWQVRVNAVAPGLVRTPLSASLLSSEALEKASAARHPLGRVGEPEDVAEAIVGLLEARWITGQVLGVDGGLATVRGR